MVKAQGFDIAEDHTLIFPENVTLKMSIPTKLIPHCPKCGKPMNMNLRSDDSFVQDDGWNVHARYYEEFLRRHKNRKTLFLDLGTGANTPIIIKIPFIHMTKDWPDATYARLNYGEAFAPDEIKKKSICINDDIGSILNKLSLYSTSVNFH